MLIFFLFGVKLHLLTEEMTIILSSVIVITNIRSSTCLWERTDKAKRFHCVAVGKSVGSPGGLEKQWMCVDGSVMILVG